MDDRFESAEALFRAGQMMEAQAAFWALARVNPRQPKVWARLGEIACRLRQFSQAFDFYGNAYDFDPNDPDIRLGLASSLIELGRGGETVSLLKTAALKRPEAYRLLAGVLEKQGETDAAIEAFEAYLAHQENDSQAMVRLAELLMQRKRYDEAERQLYFAMLLEESDPTPLVMQGNIKLMQGDRKGARADYLKALDIVPLHPPALFNLGNLAMAEDDFEDAAVFFANACEQAPDDARLANNLAVSQKELGRLDEAEAVLRDALQKDPQFADAHWNLATLRFLNGDWREGFEQAEWRWKMKDFSTPLRDFGCPVWDGADMPQGTLLVHAEQGLGDALQFVRYVPPLMKKAKRVVLECDPALHRLFVRSFPDIEILPRGQELPKASAAIALMSLPRLMGVAGGQTAYLKADPLQVQFWKDRLAAIKDGPWVGICWQGNPGHHADRRRSPGLAALLPLLDVQNVNLASLQHGAGREQLLRLTDHPLDLGDEEDPLIGHDFDTTAAIVQALDLVIAPDTAVAHLAGALGKPAWLLLPFIPDWRWQMATDTTPWYSSVRLFRQPARKDWASPVRAIAERLKDFHV
jgi:Flp pilus assembly protein TadD